MKTFKQWIEENLPEDAALGIVPDSYEAMQLPPAAWMAKDPAALWKLKKNHPRVLSNTNPKPHKKHKHAKK